MGFVSPYYFYIFEIIYKSKRYFKLGYSIHPIQRVDEWRKDCPDGEVRIIYTFAGVSRIGSNYILIGERDKHPQNSDAVVRKWFHQNRYTSIQDYKISLDNGFFTKEGLDFYDKDITDDKIIGYVKEFIKETTEWCFEYSYKLSKKEYDKFISKFNDECGYVDYNNKQFSDYILDKYKLDLHDFIDVMQMMSLSGERTDLISVCDYGKHDFIDKNDKKSLMNSYNQIILNSNYIAIKERIENWLNETNNRKEIMEKIIPSQNIKHGMVTDDVYQRLIHNVDRSDNEYVITNCFESIENIRKDFPDKQIVCIAFTVVEALGFEMMGVDNEFVIFNRELCKEINRKNLLDYFDYINTRIKEMGFWNKKCAVVGNPPYNVGNSQIYPLFYKWCINHFDDVCLIFPSGWQKPKDKKGLSVMNTPEIKYDKQIVYIDNIDNAFEGVDGAKSTNIIYWKKGYDNKLDGSQLLYNNGNNPQVVKFDTSKDDVKRVDEVGEVKKYLGNFVGMDTINTGGMPYNINTFFLKEPERGGFPNTLYDKRIHDDDIKVVGSIDRTRIEKYVDINYPFPEPVKDCHRNYYKVFIPNVWGGQSGQFLGGTYSDIYIAFPTDICTATYIESGYCKDFETVKRHAKYCMSKFARFLLLDNKFSIANSKTAWKSVPTQNYSEDFWKSDDIDYIDECLFDKYGLPEHLREFIKKNIQPRTVKNIINYNDEQIVDCKSSSVSVEDEWSEFL